MIPQAAALRTRLRTPGPPPPRRRTPPRAAPKSVASNEKAMAQALHQMMGVDLTAIPTIGVNTALVIASEIRSELLCLPVRAALLLLAGGGAGNRISGGKPLPGRAHKVVNPVAQALRMAAMTARSSQTFIGAKHRARLARKGQTRRDHRDGARACLPDLPDGHPGRGICGAGYRGLRGSAASTAHSRTWTDGPNNSCTNWSRSSKTTKSRNPQDQRLSQLLLKSLEEVDA